MHSKCKKMMFLGVIVSVISCNSNVADNSSTKTGENMELNPGLIPAKKDPNSEQLKAGASDEHAKALQYQCRLPQGKDSAECNTGFGLTSTSSSVYDYLNLAKEAYKNEYYASNVDIIEISKSIVKSKSQEEICRLSNESLKALDSVQKKFVDPYGYLKDVYDRFLVASQATKAESCRGGK